MSFNVARFLARLFHIHPLRSVVTSLLIKQPYTILILCAYNNYKNYRANIRMMKKISVILVIRYKRRPRENEKLSPLIPSFVFFIFLILPKAFAIYSTLGICFDFVFIILCFLVFHFTFSRGFFSAVVRETQDNCLFSTELKQLNL